MADDESSEDERSAGQVPVEQWVPEQKSDYTEWMDKRAQYVSDLSPEARKVVEEEFERRRQDGWWGYGPAKGEESSEGEPESEAESE